MKYTVAQIRSLTGVPSQTLRVWREKLPPIQGRNGYKACFTAGDALAIKVLQKLTNDIGLPIGRLVPLANELFSICQGGYWSILERSYLQLDLTNNALEAVPLLNCHPNTKTSLLLTPVFEEIAQLRAALMPESTEVYSQQELRFPPTAVVGGNNQ